jgi:hypothetical protein
MKPQLEPMQLNCKVVMAGLSHAPGASFRDARQHGG